MEVPSDPICRRSTWSSYKHRQTCKFLGGCTPCGACVTAGEPRGGCCSDRDLVLCSGMLDRLNPSWTTLADKGFMMHADFAENLHELLTPPKAHNNQLSFTVDETMITNKIARERALVERVFRRAQEWGILHTTIKISECDLAGSVFFVVCMMCNFDTPMIRDNCTVLRSVAEIQWGE